MVILGWLNLLKSVNWFNVGICFNFVEIKLFKIKNLSDNKIYILFNFFYLKINIGIFSIKYKI